MVYINSPINKGSSTNSNYNIKEFTCDTLASTGDVVRISSTTNNYVEVCSDNRSQEISIGIIINKPTETSCEVLLFGEVELTFSGLQKGKKVFLSPTGSLTTSVPTNGYLQCMGFCSTDNTIVLNPSMERVKMNPF